MATPAVQIALDRARVFIVEDEGIIARDIWRTVENLGYCVMGSAPSAAEALDLIAAEQPDLVLMDVKIQGEMDGIQAADIVRELYNIPVIYLTAHSDDLTLGRAKASEPFGYVVKPFTMGDIKVAIEIALQRHRLQREIEERETWVSTILRSVGEAIVVTDHCGHVSFLNAQAEELLGISMKSAAGRPLEHVVRLRADETLEHLFASPEESQAEQPQIVAGSLKLLDGSERLVIASVTEIPHSGLKQQRGSAMVLRDVSDLRKTEQALRETNSFLSRSNEQLTALSHSLAHDLKEPLRAIQCYSSLLARKVERSLGETEREYLHHITEGCGRMERLLTSLLEYYRAGVFEGNSAVPIDASIPLADAVANLRAALRASEAMIETGELPQVCAHPTALTQIFQNLIGNAIKYRRTDTPVHVRVWAERDGSFWRFAIADNGTGFDANQAEQIFELFKTAHGRERSGSGIGLATCRRLVEHFGGTMWAESNPGEGSRFYFTVPWAADN